MSGKLRIYVRDSAERHALFEFYAFALPRPGDRILYEGLHVVDEICFVTTDAPYGLDSTIEIFVHKMGT